MNIDEAYIELNKIAKSLPKEFYNKLNGGIALVEDVKIHPESKDGDLYILGSYNNDYALGRTIFIYFGSFRIVHGHLSKERQIKELESILIHEFTHHLESLAGEKDLEIKDQIEMEEYKRSLKPSEWD